MTRVLLVGYAPDSVDLTDPALPPGLTAEEIQDGIEQALADMRNRGWEADFCSVRPDDTAAQAVERHLAAASYDCVVIGGGIRLPPKGLARFEEIINAVHRGAPAAAIAFNTRPEHSAEAAERWVKRSGAR